MKLLTWVGWPVLAATIVALFLIGSPASNGLAVTLLLFGLIAGLLFGASQAMKWGMDPARYEEWRRQSEQQSIDLNGSIASNGYSAVSGRSVGGGFYTTVELAPDEQVIQFKVCSYARSPILAAVGYIAYGHMAI